MSRKDEELEIAFTYAPSDDKEAAENLLRIFHKILFYEPDKEPGWTDVTFDLPFSLSRNIEKPHDYSDHPYKRTPGN